jgi:hypothetical protein
MRRLFTQVFGILLLSGCASGPTTPESYMTGRGLTMPTTERFEHCHGYGCKFIVPIEMTKADWKPIEKIFKPAPKNAQSERAAITKATALFEQLAGAATKTTTDQAGTFRKLGDDQLDCVDESTNTTTFMDMMAQKGLIRFHTVQPPTMRLPIIHAGRWPHQTAVLRETATGELYAVDSWFRDNGAPSDVISLKEWKDGWKPNNIGDSHL